jgi:hypothetical protein
MSNEDEKKWDLPDALRVDLDTEESRLLLKKADEDQARWKAKFNTPFLNTTPQTRERARAIILTEEYEAYGLDTLTDIQLQELAEAYATLGRFDLAEKVAPTADLKTEYAHIWACVFRDDTEWCEHGRLAQFVRKDIYSIKHGETVSLLRCNECGEMNALPPPDHITKARALRAANREKYKGLHPMDAKKKMEAR